MAKGGGGARFKSASGNKGGKFPMTSQKNTIQRNAAGKAIGM